MIYFVAFLLSLAVCAQSVASGILSGNISHVRNGREPNAGVSLFPMIPLFQMLALGIAWALERYISLYALWILVGLFLILFVIWLWSYRRLKTEFDRAMLDSRNILR